MVGLRGLRPIGRQAGRIVRSARTVRSSPDSARNSGLGSCPALDDLNGQLSDRRRDCRPKASASDLSVVSDSLTATKYAGSTCPTTRNRRGQGSTARQRRFVEDCLIDLNSTQVAVRSGYSRQTARAIGSEIPTKPGNPAAVDGTVTDPSAAVGVEQLESIEPAAGGHSPAGNQPAAPRDPHFWRGLAPAVIIVRQDR